MSDNYKDLDLVTEVDRQINRIKRTRVNRVHLSERLKKYYHRWQMVFFILNFEAVFLIIQALQTNYEDNTTSLLSAFYSIYVILLQYFVNELNYNERSLKAHYHQLELEDQRFKLKKLLIMINEKENNDNPLNYSEKVRIYEDIIDDYQLILKNNENHAKLDDTLMNLGSGSNRKKQTVDDNQENNKKAKGSKKIRFYHRIDYSLDNIFLALHFVIGFLILLFIVRMLFGY